MVLRRRRTWGRALTLTLLVLAASQPELAVRERKERVMFLLDRSASVGESGEARLWELARNVAQRGAEIGVITFGGIPGLARLPGPGLPTSLSTSFRLDPERTDLGAALDLAVALLDGSGQIVLISDGRNNVGEPWAAVMRARAKNIPIHAFPVGRTDALRVLSLSGPTRVPPGDFELRAQILVSEEMVVRISLLVNGRLVENRESRYSPGLYEERFSLRIVEPGTYGLTVQAEGGPDPVPENNGLSWAVTVGELSPVVVVGKTEAPIGALLARADLPHRVVDSLTPRDLAGASLVILDNFPLGQLGPAVVEALRGWVSQGGGLWVVQGREALAGYAGPVEEILPVTYSVPQLYQEATAAIVFVLDRSGSMSGRAGEVTKIELLKDAAAAAAELVPDDDWLGALAFDRNPFWLTLPGPAAETKLALFAALAGLAPSGGTDLWPAVEWALSALAHVPARIRHIILISDGKTLREGRDFAFLYEEVRQSGVGLTSIAIGPDADLEVLSGLAMAGGGEVYFLPDPRELPAVLVQETKRALRPRFVEGGFLPLPGPAGPEFAALSLPPLLGYALTFPKPTAEVALLSSLGDPVLAFGRLGLGKVAVFNADLSGIWTEEWFGSPALGEFFGLVLARIWSERGPVAISWASDGKNLRVILDVAQGERWVQGLRFRGTLTGGSEEILLSFSQTGSGQYEAVVPLPEPGAHLLAVVEEGGRYGGTAVVPVPYSAEYAEFGPDLSTLTTVVKLTGGKILEDEEVPVLAGERREWVRLWPFLLWGSAASFVADLGLRKLRWSRGE